MILIINLVLCAAPSAKARTSCCDECICTLLALQTSGIVSTTSATLLPADTPVSLLAHYKVAAQFLQLKHYLLAEMAAAGDTSLQGCNQNVMDTVQQVIQLESAEIDTELSALRDAQGNPFVLCGYIGPQNTN